MNTSQGNMEYWTHTCTVADEIVKTCPLPVGDASVSSVGNKIFIFTEDGLSEFCTSNSSAFILACSLMGVHITTLEEQQSLLSFN